MTLDLRNFLATMGAVLFLASCAVSPAPWSKELVFQFRCGMSLTDVQQALGKKLIDETRGGAVKDPRGTHAVESEDLRTVVWFTFLENKLHGFRVAWSEAAVGYGGMKRTSYIDLCSSDTR
jgi:hypothetical protein